MTKNNYPVKVELVSCDIFMKEVPLNETTSPEIEDYIVYFCGLDCYEQWKSQGKKPDGIVGKAGS